MKLTGQCKEDFKEWYKVYVNIDIQDLSYFIEKIDYFEHATKSMQYGVLVNFFDFNNIFLSDCYLDNLFKKRYYAEVATPKGDTIYSEEVETRQEARAKAIKKANEIYNNK